MIVTPQVALRIGGIVIVAVLLQLSFFSEIVIAGSRVDILPLVVVCIGLLGGAMVGATVGFSVGLLLDLLLVQTLGVSSLVLLLVGYLAGRVREVYDVQASSLIPPVVAGGLTLAAGVGFALVAFLLGVEAQVSPLVLRDLFVKAIVATLICAPFYIAIRRLLSKALIDDRPRPFSRRRPRSVGLGSA